VERLGILACAACILWLTLAFPAQRSADTRLQVVIEPDAALTPRQIALHFRLDSESTRNVLEHTELVTAKFRARPGARVRVLARPTSLTGPQGDVETAVLSWEGSAAGTGSTAAPFSCNSGTFAGHAVVDLAEIQSVAGTMACQVTFKLTNTEHLPSGVYTGSVELSVRLD